MSLSRPVLIKVRTLSICFIIVELTSADSTDPRDEEVRGETRRGEGEQMSVKVMGEKLADTRSKVSLASSDRLRLDACALFGEAAAPPSSSSPRRCCPFRVSFPTYHYHRGAPKCVAN